MNEQEFDDVQPQPEPTREKADGLDALIYMNEHAPAEDPVTMPIARFRLRVLAFILDQLLLVLVFLLISLPLNFIFLNMGPYGRFFSLIILLAYYTTYHAKEKNGQTIGKRIMKIAVVDEDGALISGRKAFYRALPVTLFIIFNQWQLPLLNNPIGTVLSVILVFGFMLTTLLALAFNRKSKQLPHDILVGTYVIMAAPRPFEAPPATTPSLRRVLAGVVVLCGLLGVASVIASNVALELGDGRVANTVESLSDLSHLRREISKSGQFHNVGVSYNTTTFVGQGTVTSLQINGWLKQDCIRQRPRCEEIIDFIAKDALENYPQLNQIDVISVTVFQKSDFGIFSTHRAHTAQFSVENWQERLAQTP